MPVSVVVFFFLLLANLPAGSYYSVALMDFTFNLCCVASFLHRNRRDYSFFLRHFREQFYSVFFGCGNWPFLK